MVVVMEAPNLQSGPLPTVAGRPAIPPTLNRRVQLAEFGQQRTFRLGADLDASDLSKGAHLENSLESLDEMLGSATSTLDLAAAVVRDLGLAPDMNVKRVGEALMLIFEIQHEIYAVRPDLRPDFLDC